jgi:hypothetical protein
MGFFVNRPSQAAFTAPTFTQDLWNDAPWLSPNIKFMPASSASPAPQSARRPGPGRSPHVEARVLTGGEPPKHMSLALLATRPTRHNRQISARLRHEETSPYKYGQSHLPGGLGA